MEAFDNDLIQLKGTLEDIASMNALGFLEGVSGATVGPVDNSFKPKEKPKEKRGGGKRKSSEAEDAAKREKEAIELATEAIEREREQFQKSLEDIDELQRRVSEKRAEAAEKTAADIQEAIRLAQQWVDEVGDGMQLQQAAAEQLELAKATELANSAMQAQAGAMNDVVSGAVDLAASLASGELSMKDLASAALDTVGDISIKIGKSLLLMGLGLEGLKSLNPVAMIGFGALAIGAGIAMKKAAASLAPSSGPKGNSKTAGETALDRLGMKLIEAADRDRGEERAINVFVGGRQLSDITTQTVADAQARGAMMPTPLLSPQPGAF